MKTLIAMMLAVFGLLRASGQVGVELAMPQEHFLPSESVPLTVKIINRSGQQLHLGDEPDWLTFSVESADGFVVIKNAEVPVTGAFDLETSQMALKHVDLQPYFVMSKPGRYKVIATLRIKDWASQVASAPKIFNIINGAQIWQQDFGVPVPDSPRPEARKYTLIKANYLREQLRLYVQVSDVNLQRVYKVTSLGPVVSFAQPESQVDRQCRLNVLWQTGAQIFNYTVVNPDGTLAQEETYDNFTSRPHLAVDENGEVLVVGGNRRPKAHELPKVMMPAELPPMAPPSQPVPPAAPPGK